MIWLGIFIGIAVSIVVFSILLVYASRDINEDDFIDSQNDR